MANLIIAYPNYIDELELAGGSWDNAPLTNLQTRLLAHQARSTDLQPESTRLRIRMNKCRPISVIALIKHNLSLSATYRITARQSDDYECDESNSDWMPVWPGVYSSEQLNWEDDNWWSGQPSEEALRMYPHNLICVLPETYAEYVWLEINDTGNPDGYIAAGRLFLGNGWQVANNISYGAALGYVDSTEVLTLPEGPEYFTEYPQYRVLTCALNYMEQTEAYARALELQWHAGISKEILVLPDQDDLTNLIRTAFLARMRKLDPIEHIAYGRFGTHYEIKEIIA